MGDICFSRRQRTEPRCESTQPQWAHTQLGICFVKQMLKDQVSHINTLPVAMVAKINNGKFFLKVHDSFKAKLAPSSFIMPAAMQQMFENRSVLSHLDYSHRSLATNVITHTNKQRGLNPFDMF